MTALSQTAVDRILDAGLTPNLFTRWVFGTTEWSGDVCGCMDDRCTGHHHDPDEDCACFDVMLKECVTEISELHDDIFCLHSQRNDLEASRKVHQFDLTQQWWETAMASLDRIIATAEAALDAKIAARHTSEVAA